MNHAAYLFLADGFEEIEAVAPADILKRSIKNIRLVSLTGSRQVRSTHDIVINADLTWEEFTRAFEKEEAAPEKTALVFPGGMPGAKNLAGFEPLMDLTAKHYLAGGLVCAICASPGYILPVLAVKGVKVSGLHFTCYPGCEEDAVAAGALHDALPCVTDGHLITANGPGSALAFGYAICAKIISTSSTEVLMKGMMYR